MSHESINNPSVTPPKAPKPVTEEEGAAGGPATQNAPSGFSLGGKGGGGAGLEEAAPSPMELSAQTAARGVHPVEHTSVQELQAQAGDINTKVANLQNVLNTYNKDHPQEVFNPATAHLLNNHSDRTTNAVNYLSEKLRVGEFEPPKHTPGETNVVHFLNYLSGSQDQLKAVQDALANAPPGSITPATLMTLQLKMNTVQQQVEFFTVLLGKGVDDIKNIMQIQS